MTHETAREILLEMAKGIDPVTGEVLQESHLCNDPDVSNALYIAIQSLSDAISINKENGKPNAGRAWTRYDLQKLERLYHSGLSLDEICQRLQRRERGVRKKLKSLGLQYPVAHQKEESSHRPERAGQKWSREEELLLEDLYNKKWSVSEMAAELQRTKYAIYCRMDKLGLFGDEHGYTRQDETLVWNKEDNRLLREMFMTGKSIEEIMAHFGRSEKSISARLFYMGLTKESPLPSLRKKDR